MPKKFIVSSILTFVCLFFVDLNPVLADTIGSVATKGILFKDKLNVEAFDDPTIKGVTCYTTVQKGS